MSPEAKKAHRAIGARWKRIEETLGHCSGQAPYGEGTRSYKALKLIPIIVKAKEPWAASDVNDFDDQAIGAWQADVYRAEQELVDIGCKEGIKGSASQSANADPLPTYDAEKEGSWFFRLADKVDKNAPKAEDAEDFWKKVPLGAKVAGGLGLAAWFASSLAKLLRK